MSLIHHTQPTSAPSAEIRQHRLEKHVARLRIGRAAPSVLPSPSSLKRPRTDSEPFVPTQAPATETQKLKVAQARDRVWITEYCIELLLILLGLNVGPLLYYYFAVRTNDDPFTFQTGVNFVDFWTAHLTAIMRTLQHWTSQERLPEIVPQITKSYASLLALCASLLTTIWLLWNKSGILQSMAGMTKLRASSWTHLAIAWSWLGAMFAVSISNIFGWLIFNVFKFVAYILLIVFSHTFAAFAQLGGYLFLLFLFSGLGKWMETGSFQVTLPDPDALVEVTSGGGEIHRNDQYLAQLFAGAGGEEAAAMPEATSGGNTIAATITAPIAAAAAWLSESTTSSSPTSSSSSAGLLAMPEHVHIQKFHHSSIIENMNRGAYKASGFTSSLILSMFAIVKMRNADMRTNEGFIFAAASNLLLILSSVGVAVVRARVVHPAASNKIYW